jgi:ASC-1-like (ASCH) protein
MASSLTNLVLKHVAMRPDRLKDLEKFLTYCGSHNDEIRKITKRIECENISSRLLYDVDNLVGLYVINYSKMESGIPKGIQIYNFIVTSFNANSNHLNTYKSFMLDSILKIASNYKLELMILNLNECCNEKSTFFKEYILSNNIKDMKIQEYQEILKSKAEERNLNSNNTSNKRRLESDNNLNSSKRPKIDETIKKPVEVTLKKIYVNQIKRGDKTIEGRINSGMFNKLKTGDKLRFFYFQNQQDDVICKIKNIKHYKSFSEMLNNEDYRKCIPDAYDKESAIRAYDSIPGYIERAEKSGVLALHLELLNA